MMIEKKYTLKFSGSNLHESVSYVLVSKFNIIPNVLRAKIDGSGGRMILSMKGSEKDITDAIAHLTSVGIEVETMDNYVKRDENRCIDCGSCLSLCPTFAFELNTETYDIMLDTKKCVACGFCLSACPTHAITLKMTL
ncbi:MAG: 4Fe-4S binding protein [Methanomassiliicoccaceae archaeon]|jgi:NAD-dependent dihydropyrimidine dehydrogenase PreA subunit|nr:4Fe-4S binding protein [Methanomassiliicoccaceae archaeon]